MTFSTSLHFSSFSLFQLENISPAKLRHTGLMYAKTMEIYWFLVGTIRVSRYLISENRRLSKPLMTFTQVMIWLCLKNDFTFEYLF